MKFYLLRILKGWRCRAVFILALIISYLILPSQAFRGHLIPLSVLFMATFSLSLTCTVRNIKERADLARHKGSGLGLFGAVLGFSALHVCTTSGFCVAAASTGIISALSPVALHHLMSYHDLIIAAAVIIQVIALHQMHCLRVYRD
ncbi:MAG: hypothetical protein ACQEP1_05830 [Nanobdellota archaeon]